MRSPGRGAEPQVPGPGREAKCITPAALFRLSGTSSLWLFHFRLVPVFLILRDHLPSISHLLLLISSSSSPHTFTSIRSTHPLFSSPLLFPGSLPRSPYLATFGGDPRTGSAGPPWAGADRDPSLVFTSVPGSQTRSPTEGRFRAPPLRRPPRHLEESSSSAAASSSTHSFSFVFSSFGKCGLPQHLAPGDAWVYSAPLEASAGALGSWLNFEQLSQQGGSGDSEEADEMG